MKTAITILLSLPIVFLSYAQTSVNLSPVHDNYIETYGGGTGKNSFFKFDISTIPPGAVITAVDFHAYSFYHQPSWDGDVRFIRYNNQAWLETDSNVYTWNTLFFADTVIQMGGFGMVNGFSTSDDLTPLFTADYSISNTFFSFLMKDVDDGTVAPMMTGVPFNNADSILCGNIFNNKMGMRPRNYSNPNQRPFLTVSYGLPPTCFLDPGQIVCEGDVLLMDSGIVSGDGPFAYQWLFDGNPIPGATSSSLVINPLQLSDSGAYSLIVTGPFGIDTSNQAIMDISPLHLPLLGANIDTCENAIIHLDAGAGFSNYAWSVGSSTTQLLDVDTALVGIGTTNVIVSVFKPDGCYSYDTISITFNDCGSGIESLENQSLEIYPNPHHGSFSLVVPPLAESGRLEILNGWGEVIYSIWVDANMDEQNIQVNIAQYANGLYMIRFHHQGIRFQTKTIKQ